MGQPIYIHAKPVHSTPAVVITAANNKDTLLCHPLACPVGLNSTSSFASLALPRSRRKHSRMKTPKRICGARYYVSQDLILPQQYPTVSPLRPNDTRLETPAEVREKNRFQLILSEYQLHKSKPDALSETSPSLIPSITQRKHSFSSPAINLIPLGLCRISQASSQVNSSPSSRPTRIVSRKRISKSDISEARWWVKMYESFVWHMQQQRRSQPCSYELAFFTRLENMVQRRWYPIMRYYYGERSPIITRDPNESADPSGSCYSPKSADKIPIRTRYQNTLNSQLSGSVFSDSQILDPAQLAAQAILRRHQLTSRRLRRKRTPSSGRSSLRSEMVLAA